MHGKLRTHSNIVKFSYSGRQQNNPLKTQRIFNLCLSSFGGREDFFVVVFHLFVLKSQGNNGVGFRFCKMMGS